MKRLMNAYSLEEQLDSWGLAVKHISNDEYLMQELGHYFKPTDVIIAIAKQVVDERNEARAGLYEIEKLLKESHRKEQARQKKEQEEEKATHDDCRVCGKRFNIMGQRLGVSIAHCSDECRQKADIVNDRRARAAEALERKRSWDGCLASPEGDWYLQRKYYDGD